MMPRPRAISSLCVGDAISRSINSKLYISIARKKSGAAGKVIDHVSCLSFFTTRKYELELSVAIER